MEDSDIELKTSGLLRQISALSRKGQFAEALKYAQEYSALCETTHGLEADETLGSLLSMAKLLMKNSQHVQAIEILEKARDAASSLSTPNPSIVAYALSGIAASEWVQGNSEAAKESVLAALNVIEHSYSLVDVHAISEILQDLTEVLYNLNGSVELRNIYATILKITRELDDESLSSIISKVITAAKWFYQNDDLESANILAEKALQFMSSKTQGEDADSAELNEIIGVFLLSQGNIDAAEKSLLVALDLKRKLYGNSAIECVAAQIGLSEAWLHTGRTKDAGLEANKAIKILKENVEAEKTIDEARALSILGEISLINDNLKEAEDLFRTSLNLFNELKPSAYSEKGRLLHNLGVIALNNENNESISLLEEAASIRKKHLGVDHADYAQSLWSLGKCYENIGRINEARKTYKESLSIQELLLDENDPMLQSAEEYVKNLGLEETKDILPKTNFIPLDTAFSRVDSTGAMPEKKFSQSRFPGNMAGHLMLSALLALENQNPDIAAKILRESISIFGIQRHSREVDLESAVSVLSRLLEDLSPEET